MPQLSESHLRALLGESEWVWYKHHQATRDYHFMKLDRDKLLKPDPVSEQEAADAARARKLYLGSLYDLPEFRVSELTRAAALDFTAALKKKRVPAWVLNTAPYDEIKQKAGEK